VQTRTDAAQALWQTPPGAVHFSVVQTRPDAAQALWQTPPGAVHSSTSKANGYRSEAKRSESFANYVFFDIEAKRTLSIVGKFISKRSEHVYIKEFKKRSEANTFDSLNIYFEAKRTCLY
jgi:hypothetical protein